MPDSCYQSYAALLLAAGLLVAGTSAATQPMGTVAVLDFTMDAATVKGVDWASGAADLMEVELARQGVELLERREIRLALGERRNYRAGLISADSLKADGISRPRAFLTGSFIRVGEKQFNLQAKLVSVQDGTDLATTTTEGSYPGEWMKCLCAVASNLVTALPGLSRESARKDLLPGTSRNPEAAAEFYRGLANYAEGNLEEAWFAFHRARNMDPDFRLAEAWEMRALDSCGMPRHAAIVRDHLSAQPNGALTLGMSVASQLKSKGNVVWILDAERGLPANWVQVLRQGLQKEAHVRFFDPARVVDLAREADLQFSGEMAVGGCPDSSAWMGAESLLKIRVQSAGVRLSLHDLATGQMLASIEASLANPPGPSLLMALALASTSGTNSATATNLTTSAVSMPRNENAQILWKYRRNPDDPRAILDLLFCFNYIGEYLVQEGRHQLVLVEQLAQALASPKWQQSPEIAFWVAQLQFIRFDAEAKTDVSRHFPPVLASLAEVFRPVLERYPSTLAANMARYSMAGELGLAGKHEEAVTLLCQVWQDLATNPAGAGLVTNRDVKDYRANVGFALASELGSCGRNTEALEIITKTLDEVPEAQKRPRLLVVPLAKPGPFEWQIASYENYLSLMRFRHNSAFASVWCIRPEMEQLAGRLRTAADQVAAPVLLPAMLLDRAGKVSGHEAAHFYLQFLDQSLGEVKGDVEPNAEFFNVVAWLHLEKLPVEDVMARSNFVDRAAVVLATDRARYSLFAAAGRPDEAAVALRAWIDVSYKERRFDALTEYATFYSILDSPAASRALLQKECARFLATRAIPESGYSIYWLEAFSPVLVNVNLPDELEKLWGMANTNSGPISAQFWTSMAGYLRGDAFLATEGFRKIVEHVDKTRGIQSFAEQQAGSALTKLRNFGYVMGTVSVAPEALASDRQAAIRALQLHMETEIIENGRDLFWKAQGARHLKESGPDLVAVWLRLLQHPRISGCARISTCENHAWTCNCDEFAGIQPPPTAHDLAALVRPLERLVVQWDFLHPLQFRAPLSLGYIGKEAAEAVPVLIAATASEYGSGNAKWALARIGRPLVRCAPQLALLLAHPENKVCVRAAKALASIEGVPPDLSKDVSESELPAKMLAWWESDAAQVIKKQL